MPRKTSSDRESKNTFQVAFKIPKDWIVTADEIVLAMRKEPGVASTRTDILRAALDQGLTQMSLDRLGSRPPRKTRRGAGEAGNGT